MNIGKITFYTQGDMLYATMKGMYHLMYSIRLEHMISYWDKGVKAIILFKIRIDDEEFEQLVHYCKMELLKSKL